VLFSSVVRQIPG